MMQPRLSSFEETGCIAAVYTCAVLMPLGLALLLALLSPIIGIGLYFLVSGN